MNESKPKPIQHKVLKKLLHAWCETFVNFVERLAAQSLSHQKHTTHITKDTCNMFQVDGVASAP